VEKKENFADYDKAHQRAEFIAKNLAEGRIGLTGIKVSDMEILADLRKRLSQRNWIYRKLLKIYGFMRTGR
jgi:hypothetical protein